MRSCSKKIGIMGGTFNPIHYGHLMIAEDARCFCNLDEVIFIPSGNSYMKEADDILSGELRFHMVKLAISSNEYFICSDIEIKRTGNSYTYETLEELRKHYPEAELYFILGADNLFTIEKWKCSERIFKECSLIAASRGEVDFDSLKKQADSLKKNYQANVILLPERKMDISSTEIRECILNNQSVRYMMPEEVYDYIFERKLYSN